MAAAGSGVGWGRSMAATAAIGVGMVAAVDQIVFHQLLGWHHFYDESTSDVALLSDGLLHAGEFVALVAGFYVLADLRRRRAVAAGAAWSGLFLGSGGFQLLDGMVNHKLLRLHQIRYGVDILPYDLAWNGSGAALLATGFVIAVWSWRGAAAHRDVHSPGHDGGAADTGRAAALLAAVAVAYLAAATRTREWGA